MRNNLKSVVTRIEGIKHDETDETLQEDEDYTGTQQKTHKCTYNGCNASFVRPSKLARHIRSHTGERPYKCDHPGCDKAYTNSSHLKRHINMHKTVKQVYQCALCSLSVSTPCNLKRHVRRVHEAANKLTCDECKAEFNKKHQLAKHLYTHIKFAPFKCDKCNVSYTNHLKLKQHKASHKDSTQNYVCDILACKEVFRTWQQLCSHKKAKHVKEYKCSKCDKLFLSKVHLKNHSVVHSENRPVVACPYEKCHKTYYRKSNLEQHIRVYHKCEKFYCDICSIGLVSKQKLIQHMQSFHLVQNKKKSRKKQRKKRKDAGNKKKSTISALIGIVLPASIEKRLLQQDRALPVPSESVEMMKT